jgi:tetratricopeptide (TPR) repeat protein
MSRIAKKSAKDELAKEYCRQHDVIWEGSQLSSEEIRQLEQWSNRNPDDFEARMRLLGAYFLKTDIPSRKARRGHAMWVIEHRPSSDIAGMPYAQMDPQRDGEEYFNAAADLWQEQAKRHANDVSVLSHAAHFFMVRQAQIARRYFRRCVRLDPENYRWPQTLGLTYLMRPRGKNPGRSAVAAYRHFERALELADPKEERCAVLADAALAAFRSRNYDAAKAHATERVQKPGPRSNWNYGNAVHGGNAMLGRIALMEGNIGKAKRHLLAAGKTPGSPQLNSFGPDMSLAKELLDLGEKDTVLKYLTSCCRFWKRPLLEGWISEIQSGKKPDFSHCVGP